uniref:Putative conserved plasma membrane protein n=1 Tax=Amblyomma cajennense TaxID=34607 RepID=A0A023FQP7_AMBCJ
MGLLLLSALLGFIAVITEVSAQGAGGYDFNAQSEGQLIGQLSPLQVAGISMVVVACLGATVVSMFFCYYVYKKNKENLALPRY